MCIPSVLLVLDYSIVLQSLKKHYFSQGNKEVVKQTLFLLCMSIREYISLNIFYVSDKIPIFYFQGTCMNVNLPVAGLDRKCYQYLLFIFICISIYVYTCTDCK